MSNYKISVIKGDRIGHEIAPAGYAALEAAIAILVLPYNAKTFFFVLTWLYPHIREKFFLDAVTAGWYASLP